MAPTNPTQKPGSTALERQQRKVSKLGDAFTSAKLNRLAAKNPAMIVATKGLTCSASTTVLDNLAKKNAALERAVLRATSTSAMTKVMKTLPQKKILDAIVQPRELPLRVADIQPPRNPVHDTNEKLDLIADLQRQRADIERARADAEAEMRAQADARARREEARADEMERRAVRAEVNNRTMRKVTIAGLVFTIVSCLATILTVIVAA